MDMQTSVKVKIESTGIYLPDQIVKSDDLFAEIDSERQYNIPINWMSEVMGIEERRMAPADAKPSDLAIPAARMAIEDCAEVSAEDIELVIFCGIERDQPEPATAHVIQNALGLKARHAFDVGNACYGFMDGLEIAANFIKTGSIRHALIVTGETPTKVLRSATAKLKAGVDISTAKNILGGLSVGDAGGAVILSPSYGYDCAGFEIFNTITESTHFNKCIYHIRPDGSINGQMLMAPIVKAVTRCHQNLIADTLEKLNWTDFDWMLSHQVGKRYFERISELQGVDPIKMIKNYDKLGNIASASFPVNFNNLTKGGKVVVGDRIGGCFAGSGLAIGQMGYTF